jgi:hypothetical protein
MGVSPKPAGKAKHDEPVRLLPISDTVNGSRARECPGDVLAHYEHLSGRLWLPPQLGEFAKTVLGGIGVKRTTWASLTGPYGFGKTAAGILLWHQARQAGFLAIPPLSCSNYDEFAAGVAALAAEQLPKEKKRIEKLHAEIWTGGIERIAKVEAERHDIPVRKLRKVLEDQFENGRWAPDGHSHRLVEFLSRLGQLSIRSSRGLVVIIDELQQLLGPIDVASLSHLREFVWGMRTEQSPCAVILTLDTQLEARLAHWAADLLHRVRENSPALQMTAVFNREFPRWLWQCLTEPNGKPGKALPHAAVSDAVLDSLGQFVERPDLSNGPRTVVDVFNRALERFSKTKESYRVCDMVDDIHQGRFAFFGEGAPVQRILTCLLSDAWIGEDSVRRELVRTLAAFPRGCPEAVIREHVDSGRKLKAARDEMFGPLLVELPGGLALEQMQQVSRGGSSWENALARCWDSMPAASALAETCPELIARVLLPRLFPGLNLPAGDWAMVEGDARAAISGFQIVRGSFDTAYPAREVAVWIGQKEPDEWLDDVDLCIGFVCLPDTTDAAPKAELANLGGTPRVLFSMPTLVPMDTQVPAEIARYQKYIQPEPLRPAFVLLGLRELQGFDAGPGGNGKGRKHTVAAEAGSAAERRKMEGFRELCLDYLMRFLLQGEIDAGVGSPVRQRGPELVRALFSELCRRRYPSYQTLMTGRHWKGVLDTYCSALGSDHVNPAQRCGQEDVTMSKTDAYRLLFNQSSTAAGDSFIRSLGPLVKVTAKGDSWSLRFCLHPGEAALIEFLRNCDRSRAVTASASAESLRHKGYGEEEAARIVSIIEARGMVTVDQKRGVRLVGRKGTADMAAKRVLSARDRLALLDATPQLPETLPSVPGELARLADTLEGQLEERMEACRAARQRQLDELRAAIGNVRSITLTAQWLETGLSKPLAGIGETLKRTQAALTESLRKEADRIQAELSESGDPFERAVRWVQKQETAKAQLDKLKGRSGEFTTQSAALLTWMPVNQELFSVTNLATKIVDTDPAPAHQLEQLLARMRERFTTESWEPVHSADAFRGDVQAIGKTLQGLLYSQIRTYVAEVDQLRQKFARLLPATPSPSFETESGTQGKRQRGYDAFSALYQWAMAGFSEACKRAKKLKGRGQTWADPRKNRKWSDLLGNVERSLEMDRATIGLHQVLKAGEWLNDLLDGFEGTSTGVFDTPEDVPDFDAIRERFLRGEVVIRIEPRQSQKTQ